jgi:hypothetical protein
MPGIATLGPPQPEKPSLLSGTRTGRDMPFCLSKNFQKHTGMWAMPSNHICMVKKAGSARRWWLTPVIPAAQEAEIRRIEV